MNLPLSRSNSSLNPKMNNTEQMCRDSRADSGQQTADPGGQKGIYLQELGNTVAWPHKPSTVCKTLCALFCTLNIQSIRMTGDRAGMPGTKKARGPELVSSGFIISILDEDHCRQVSGKAAQ